MTQSPFGLLSIPKPDPLFAIGTEARLAGPTAINGTLGVVMDEQGVPLLFPSVKKAIEKIATTLPTLDYSYPKLTGLDEYRSAVAALLPAPESMYLASMASTGGTGGLAINVRLMRMMLGDSDPAVILPVPAWGNHPPPCKAAGLRIIEVPYIENGVASIQAMIDAVKKEKRPVGLLLQVGCHNPTGLDLSKDQWEELVTALEKEQVIVLLDCAYQGFIGEPLDDIQPIRLCIEHGIPSLVVWSASKNHTIYGLRTGMACAYVPEKSLLSTVEGHYSSITRMLHSASATFGQHVVVETQISYKDEWLADLQNARAVINEKRALMTEGLPDSFKISLRGYGMFAKLPLNEEQIHRLKTEHKVYITLDGRMNIAGIPKTRISELREKIIAVL